MNPREIPKSQTCGIKPTRTCALSMTYMRFVRKILETLTFCSDHVHSMDVDIHSSPTLNDKHAQSRAESLPTTAKLGFDPDSTRQAAGRGNCGSAFQSGAIGLGILVSPDLPHRMAIPSVTETGTVGLWN